MKIANQNITIELQSLLFSRKCFYQMVHLLFLDPGKEEVLLKLKNSADFQELSDIYEGGKILSRFFQKLTKEQISNEREEFQRLFIGPGPLAAPPWESYYRSKDNLLFDEWTYQIRELFHQFGLQSEKEHKEPDDHLLLELEFMIYLADLFAQETDPDRFANLLDSQIHMLENHFIKWIPYFCERVIASTTSQLYLGAALLLADFLEDDLLFLDALKKGETFDDV